MNVHIIYFGVSKEPFAGWSSAFVGESKVLFHNKNHTVTIKTFKKYYFCNVGAKSRRS